MLNTRTGIEGKKGLASHQPSTATRKQSPWWQSRCNRTVQLEAADVVMGCKLLGARYLRRSSRGAPAVSENAGCPIAMLGPGITCQERSCLGRRIRYRYVISMLRALASLCVTAARQVLMAGLVLFLICGGFCGHCLAGTSSGTPSADSCLHAAALARDQDPCHQPVVPAVDDDDDVGQDQDDDAAACCGCACICHQATVLPVAPELPVLMVCAVRMAYPSTAPCADSADRSVEAPPLIV